MATTKNALWIGAACILLGFTWFVFRTFLSSDTLYTQRGSLTYHLVVTRLVQEIPRYGARDADAAQYSSSKGGSAPAYDALSYCAAAAPESVNAFFDRYFGDRGFAAERHGWGQSYTSKTDQVRLSIADNGACGTHVRLRHYSVH